MPQIYCHSRGGGIAEGNSNPNKGTQVQHTLATDNAAILIKHAFAAGENLSIAFVIFSLTSNVFLLFKGAIRDVIRFYIMVGGISCRLILHSYIIQTPPLLRVSNINMLYSRRNLIFRVKLISSSVSYSGNLLICR